MAKLPALMEALRKYVHHETPAIRYAARELRERQLLTLGPGGRGSPDMTTRDAVNLALALTVSIDSSRYADTVETLNSLKRVEKVAPPRWAKPGFDVVCRAQTFGEALIALVDCADALAVYKRGSNVMHPQPGQTDDRLVVAAAWVNRRLSDYSAVIRLEDTGVAEGPIVMSFGDVHDERNWAGVISQVGFDQALFITLKRTLEPKPPWVFEA